MKVELRFIAVTLNWKHDEIDSRILLSQDEGEGLKRRLALGLFFSFALKALQPLSLSHINRQIQRGGHPVEKKKFYNRQYIVNRKLQLTIILHTLTLATWVCLINFIFSPAIASRLFGIDHARQAVLGLVILFVGLITSAPFFACAHTWNQCSREKPRSPLIFEN